MTISKKMKVEVVIHDSENKLCNPECSFLTWPKSGNPRCDFYGVPLFGHVKLEKETFAHRTNQCMDDFGPKGVRSK